MNFIAKSLVVLTVLCAMQLSAYQIIVSQDATPAEKTAASELSYYLPQLSEAGEAVPVVTVRDESLGAALHVGQSEEALAALGLGAWSELKPDEVCYRVDASGDMWIAGDRPRGTLYAVYEFLEREYGVRLVGLDEIRGMDCVIVAVAHREFREMGLEQLRALFREGPDEEKVLIDVKGLYPVNALKASGMRWWRL